MILASVMARRSILGTVGGFNERLPVLGCEDWDLWLRIARHAPVCVVSEELTGYRRHGRNTDAAQLLASGLAVLAQHYADATTPHVATLSHASAQARLLWYHAGAAAETSRRLAWPLMLRALQTAPQAALARPAVGALYRFAFGVAPITVARAAGSMPWPPVPDSAAANTTANPGCSSPE